MRKQIETEGEQIVGQNQKNTQEPDMNQLRKVRREKLAELQQNGRDPFQITKFNQTHHSLEVKDLYEAHEAEILKDHQQPNVEGMDEEQAKEALKNDYEERRSIMDASPIHVAIAGRMMFKRVMGKASFCNIQDLQGNIQVYVARDAIGTDAYADFKKSDIGDIFGLEGFTFRTRTGEISIHAEKMTLLSKSLQMLPEKFHGLTDTDTRYRQRYVDLIMNADSKDTFIKRSKILAAVRKYLSGEGFMEVETPMLVANAGGAAARPFETHFNALNEDLKLRISLELYLKSARMVGQKKAREIWFLCRQYSAQEAERMGMVNKVVPFDQLEDECVAWAEEMMERSPIALRMIKAGLNAELDGQAGIQQLAGDATMLYYFLDEAQEGGKAFLEKRKPDFDKYPQIP